MAPGCAPVRREVHPDARNEHLNGWEQHFVKFCIGFLTSPGNRKTLYPVPSGQKLDKPFSSAELPGI
jgi:hypothetical protein